MQMENSHPILHRLKHQHALQLSYKFWAVHAAHPCMKTARQAGVTLHPRHCTLGFSSDSEKDLVPGNSVLGENHMMPRQEEQLAQAALQRMAFGLGCRLLGGFSINQGELRCEVNGKEQRGCRGRCTGLHRGGRFGPCHGWVCSSISGASGTAALKASHGSGASLEQTDTLERHCC